MNADILKGLTSEATYLIARNARRTWSRVTDALATDDADLKDPVHLRYDEIADGWMPATVQLGPRMSGSMLTTSVMVWLIRMVATQQFSRLRFIHHDGCIYVAMAPNEGSWDRIRDQARWATGLTGTQPSAPTTDDPFDDGE